MYRIDIPSAAASLPTPSALGTEGFWTAGVPGTVPATVMDQDWFNMVQEELIAFLTAAGITHSKSTRNQVLTSVQQLIASGSLGLAGYSTDLLAVPDGTTPNTKSGVTASEALLQNASGLVVRAAAVSQSIDYTTTGAGGLDTGALAPNTFYYEYLIWNPTTSTLKALGSTSPTAPTMPSGYTYKVRYASRLTDGSSHFYRMRKANRETQYLVGTNPTTPFVVASGSAGSISVPTYTTVSLSSFLPPTARRFRGVAGCTGANSSGIAVAPNASWPGNASTVFGFAANQGAAGANVAIPFDSVLESLNFFYASNVSSGFLAVVGYSE